MSAAAATRVARDRDPAVDAPNLAPPPGNPRFAHCDGVRAIAALSVFVGHTITGTYGFVHDPARFRLAVQLAYEGVAIFFLISGFLLYRPFLVARRRGEPVSLGAYARRRVLRIVPAYWVALSLLVLLGLAPGVTTGNWWVFYGFGQIYDAQMIGHGIGVAWTLCIEMSFYAVLPLFALAAARLSRGRTSVSGDVLLLVVLSAASLLFRAHFHSFLDTEKVSTLPGTFGWFALGMAVAVLSVADEHGARWGAAARSLGRRAGVLWLAALALSVGPYMLMSGPQSIAAALSLHVLYGVIALLILLPAALGSDGHVRGLLGSRVLMWIGLVSYAFYLYHSAIIARLIALTHGWQTALRYPFVLTGSFVLTCVCASLSYYLLERPCLRLGWVRASHADDSEPPDAEPVATVAR